MKLLSIQLKFTSDKWQYIPHKCTAINKVLQILSHLLSFTPNSFCSEWYKLNSLRAAHTVRVIAIDKNLYWNLCGAFSLSFHYHTYKYIQHYANWPTNRPTDRPFTRSNFSKLLFIKLNSIIEIFQLHHIPKGYADMNVCLDIPAAAAGGRKQQQPSILVQPQSKIMI